MGESFFFFCPDPLTKRLASNGWGGTGRNFQPVRRRLVFAGRIRLFVQHQNLDGMLVVDVATEVQRTCLLPVRADAYPQNMDPMVYTFEMSGRLCLP